MRTALGSIALAFVLTLSAFATSASAHAAPDPLDNSVHVLADEGEDTFYWYDGYDLYNLFVREAYMEPMGEEGIVLRFTLYGGFAPAGTSDQMAIDVHGVTAGGEQTLTMTTSDDQTWEGDMEVLAANVTEDDPPFTGVTARMQVFASYEQLGVAPGGSVEEISMVSRADDDVRDIAPGGFFVPNSQGQGEVPADSQRLVDSLELQGPHGYLDAQAQPTAEGIDVTVENTLANGQHVSLDVKAPTGWNASLNGSAQVSLPGGETTTFTVDTNATPDATDPLSLHVVSDLGAHQQLYAGVNGTEILTAASAQDVEVDPAEPQPNESPALPAIAILALLAGLAAGIRRDA